MKRLCNRKVWKWKQQLSRIYFFLRRGNTENLYYKHYIEYYNIHCHLLENGYIFRAQCGSVLFYIFLSHTAREICSLGVYTLSVPIDFSLFREGLPKRSDEYSMYVILCYCSKTPTINTTSKSLSELLPTSCTSPY